MLPPRAAVGQDIVVAAFANFLRSHPTAVLVTAWGTLFPDLVATLKNFKVARGAPVRAMPTPFSAVTLTLHSSRSAPYSCR